MKIEIDQKRMRLDTLALERSAEKADPFNPRIDITPKDREELKVFFTNVGAHWEILSDVCIIDPVLGRQISNQHQNEWRDIFVDFQGAKQAQNFYNLTYLKIVKPSLARHIEKDSTLLMKMKNEVLTRMGSPWNRGYYNDSHMMSILRQAHMLFPMYATNTGFIESQSNFRSLQDVYIQRNIQPHGKGHLFRVYNLSKLRYVSEERFCEEKKNYPIDWAAMRQHLMNHRNVGDWMLFARLASDLTHIVAKEVVVTPDTFEIILPEKHEIFQAPKTPLPITRNF